MNNKLRTQKDYQERINRTLIYIQQHYGESISLCDLAKISNFSQYHFHRIFTAFIGESVYTYVRRFRIQRAAHSLVYTKDSITSIALASGFETSSSFSKAFKKILGITPRECRLKGSISNYVNLSLNAKMSTGETMMKPIMKTIEEQKVIFIRRCGSYVTAAPEAWKKLAEYVNTKAIPEKNTKVIGIAHDDPAVTSEKHWRYDACISGLENPIADGEVGIQTIDGGKYAVFEHIGPYDTLGDTYRKIYGQWYPASDAKLRDAPAFVHYVDRTFKNNYGEMSAEEKGNLVTHVYVPVD